jgi:hypothetical protein
MGEEAIGVAKCSLASTPAAHSPTLSLSIRRAARVEALEKLFVEGVTPSDVATIVHGTATNALLELR